jgi:anti-sigma factor ChrR (cupin superfamily)
MAHHPNWLNSEGKAAYVRQMKAQSSDPSPTPAWREHAHGLLVFPNLTSLAEDQNPLQWEPFHPGVDIHWLYREDDHGHSAALIRFQPGGAVPLHEHRGFEHIYILSGSQSDGNGCVNAGSLMVHRPGTRHRIVSEEGCLVLAIYEKPAQFIVRNGGTIP